MEVRLREYWPARIMRALLTMLFLGWILQATSPDIDRARRVHYHERTAPWRSFASQFYSQHPNLPENVSLAFYSPPFNFDSHERWCLDFLIRLKYQDRSIKVFRLPEQSALFNRSVAAASEVHILEWEDGVLLPKPPP
jgi:hypothetical protein